MDNRKTLIIILGIIIIIVLLLLLFLPKEDLIGEAIRVTRGNCASISPDPEETPQELLNQVAVFTLEPLQNVREITSVTGNAQLGLQFYKEVNVITLSPIDGEQIMVNCITLDGSVATSQYSITLV